MMTIYGGIRDRDRKRLIVYKGLLTKLFQSSDKPNLKHTLKSRRLSGQVVSIAEETAFFRGRQLLFIS